ncbi:MAG TPA: hypothetical protein VF403_08740 [Kofleriaceae bacterium]
MDWGAWSKEAVSLMTARTRELLARHSIPTSAAYHWDLDAGVIVIGEATFGLTTVGTVDDASFLWAWANDALPANGKRGIEAVRQFGLEHGLGLLVEPCARAGLAQAKECLAIAGRILDARGIWIDKTEVGSILFVLYERVAGN